jgi:hypothetical protein
MTIAKPLLRDAQHLRVGRVGVRLAREQTARKLIEYNDQR